MDEILKQHIIDNLMYDAEAEYLLLKMRAMLDVFIELPKSNRQPACQLYKYAWGNNPKRARMKGRTCKLLASGKMSSVLIEFTDNGQREITSRRALRRIINVE